MVERTASSLTKHVVSFLVVSVLIVGCTPTPPQQTKRVLILGVDGLDPKLLQQFMDAGSLPNFKKLIAQGDFKPLGTTMPPLSPVAWSGFITGLDPGGHGIFDFVHRDPRTLLPELSMSKAVPSNWSFSVGSWVIPLSSGKVEQLRQGKTFWEILEEHGVPTMVFKMPANFPPSPSTGQALSGMGTPDILGTPGTFSFYTNDPPENSEDVSGGQVFKVSVIGNRIKAQLVGPENMFRRVPQNSSMQTDGFTHPQLTVDFAVFIDPQYPVAKFVVQDNEFILKEGEWSDWIRVDFQAVPYLVNMSAVARFYLQSIRPSLKLYVSPLQINPEDAVMPISVPESWAHDLCEELGYFYTQGLPSDTNAFSGGFLSGREFREQSQFVFHETLRALDYFLPRFKEGLLFFYISNVDQDSHMLWRYTDRDHPAYVYDEQLSHGIQNLYEEIDKTLGHIMHAIDENTTLIIMSDHGFSPFYWGVNLNSWLLEAGYITLKDPSTQEQQSLFTNADWTRTKAYALGLNGVYVNLRGRERHGIVAVGDEYRELLNKLEADLLAIKDPRNGRNPVTLVTQTHRDFHGTNLDRGPDIIVGYNWGYRSSWESPLGKFPKEIFVDNRDPWSGDHSIDHRLVPGVLITNRDITLDNPTLYDLTVAVLDEYGIAKLPEMIGQDCVASAP